MHDERAARRLFTTYTLHVHATHCLVSLAQIDSPCPCPTSTQICSIQELDGSKFSQSHPRVLAECSKAAAGFYEAANELTVAHERVGSKSMSNEALTALNAALDLPNLNKCNFNPTTSVNLH